MHVFVKLLQNNFIIKNRSIPKDTPMVREAGVEPARPCEHWHLKPASLPIPPLAQAVELRCFSATWLYYHTAARMSTFFCWFFRTMLPPDGSRPSAGSFQAALDKRINYDRISLLNAQMEQIAASGPQRGGRVRAPGRRTAQATPERPGRPGRPIPVTWDDNEGSPMGIIRVVPWKKFFRP